ncbi:transposase [Streptococcus pluranimalium]|uniref:transposase n=1 Tax=Streptococcus pluranimalium TaxID=82348 RepID=UPI003F68CB1B
MKAITRKAYDTDLTDQEWAQLESYFSKHRIYKWSKRELVNATLYITKTGCQWRILPHDFPPYPTVWSFFRRAKESGLWDTILTELVKKSD